MSTPPLDPGPCTNRIGGHCWHPTGEIFTSSPIQVVEYCCNCDANRRRIADSNSDVNGHGPFLRPSMRTR